MPQKDAVTLKQVGTAKNAVAPETSAPKNAVAILTRRVRISVVAFRSSSGLQPAVKGNKIRGLQPRVILSHCLIRLFPLGPSLAHVTAML